MAIWMDMTNSLVVWKGGIVGIVRAELMLAKSLHELDSNIKFSVCTTNGFKEVLPDELNWLFTAENLGKAYATYQNKRSLKMKGIRYIIRKWLNSADKRIVKLQQKFNAKQSNPNKSKRKKRLYRSLEKRAGFLHALILSNLPENQNNLSHPYEKGDIIFSCGWYSSNKEKFFERIKEQLPDINLVYTIYDIIMAKEGTRHFYMPEGIVFEDYIKWISSHCDFIVYGGETAKNDSEAFFARKGWNIPEGMGIEWGGNINTNERKVADKSILGKIGIKRPFVLAVGSFEPRKNYRVLYQAYCMLALDKQENVPDLVIAGKAFAEHDLAGQIAENPLTKNKIHVVSPTDEELEALYQYCDFVLLPTLYEGYSLVLPETLDHGKLCLCAKVPPLEEVGKDMVVYLDPHHPAEWAKAIVEFSSNRQLVAEWEQKVKRQWTAISWNDCAKKLYDNVLIRKSFSDKFYKEESHSSTLYYDMTLFFHEGSLSGIPRVQMILARYLSKKFSNIKFFSFHTGEYMEIPASLLSNILSDMPIDEAVTLDRKNMPYIKRRKQIPFKKGDIVFTTGMGFHNATYDSLYAVHTSEHFNFIQLIYDFTPILIPHTHHKATVEHFPNYINQTLRIADNIIYGGETAKLDGEKYQRGLGLDPIPSYALKFGSDIQARLKTNEDEETSLANIGIKGEFLLTVGTIEARKNHELLYEAYLELIRNAHEDEVLPQLVICGHPGWRTDDFQRRFAQDERIKGKIIMFSPTDEELDTLYKNCKFTLLASQYEGWSLTLPEALNYGKFCLAADVAPLREVGQNIIDYANPYDPEEWAKKIRYYCENKKALAEREELIKKHWNNTTWRDCAENVSAILAETFNKINEGCDGR